MAISKIMHMKDSGSNYHGMHLKRSIDYITVAEKTQDGRLIGSVNCIAKKAYEQMRETKLRFNKNNQRQGYHIVLSFKEGEVDADTVFEITEKFVAEFIGERYEAVFAVHDNTEHIHSHIVYNSVSFLDGRKYHYAKGDWEKEIQPITNRLCKEYGLSVIELDGERANSEEKAWRVSENKRFIWGNMIKRDIDACIIMSATYESFIKMLETKGYEVKQGKYLAVKPPGMNRFRRCKTLGDDYREEMIRERIVTESLNDYKKEKHLSPKIVKCSIKRYRRAKLSGLQKKYFAKLYRTGRLKKRAYSQAWKYKSDIEHMNKLQQQYLFLARHNIRSMSELIVVINSLTNKKDEVNKEKSKIYKARAKCKSLFDIVDRMDELVCAKEAFIGGDEYFQVEYNQWQELEEQLQSQGYTYDEVKRLKEHYKNEIAKVSGKAAVIKKEMWNADSILKDITDTKREMLTKKEINDNKDIRVQPKR